MNEPLDMPEHNHPRSVFCDRGCPAVWHMAPKPYAPEHVHMEPCGQCTVEDLEIKIKEEHEQAMAERAEQRQVDGERHLHIVRTTSGLQDASPV